MSTVDIYQLRQKHNEQEWLSFPLHSENVTRRPILGAAALLGIWQECLLIYKEFDMADAEAIGTRLRAVLITPRTWVCRLDLSKTFGDESPPHTLRSLP